MKTIYLIRLLLVSSLLSLTGFARSDPTPPRLTLVVDEEGVIRRDDKIVSLEEVRTTAKDLAHQDPKATVAIATSGDADQGVVTQVIETLKTEGLKDVVVRTETNQGETETTGASTLAFSDPSKPGTLKVTITNGDIHIRGTEAPTLSVHTQLKQESSHPRKDGLRVLTSSSSYSLTEKNNVATLSYGAESWPNAGGDFDITVPHKTNIIISSAFGGDIEIGEVTGDLEIKSLNGEVKLADVSGGALVETMNGEIHASLRSIVSGKPLSFTSMNGAVSLRLPYDIKANVRLRTHNGSILTDFDEKQLVTKTVALKGSRSPRPPAGSDAEEIRESVREAVRMGMDAAREAARGARDAMRESNGENADGEHDEHDMVPPIPPMAPLPPMTGGKIVTGSLNGGGPEIRIVTMNGDVTLRKSDGK
jgi:hypothetical protein